MRFLLISLLLLIFSTSRANDSLLFQIKINFLYGSKPAKGFKQTESKCFGGLKGGHVNIEAGGRVLDFRPGNNPLFPQNKKPTGGYSISETAYKNKSTGCGVSTLEVPYSSQ